MGTNRTFVLFSIATVAALGIFLDRIGIIKAMSSGQLVSLEFEVYGRVQGVFFRKYTVEKGAQLGLQGWCMNTARGTVLGQMEGDTSKVEEMKRWLNYTGSPMSQIEKAEFRNEKNIDNFTFKGFKVRH